MIGAAAGIHYEKIFNFLSKYRKNAFRSAIFLILAAIFVKGFVYEFNLPIALEILLPLIFGSLFAILIVLGTQKSIDLKSTHHRITVYLGTISYGLYVYHMVALTLVLFILDRLNILSGIGVQGIYSFIYISAICLAITITISYLSFKYIEKPFLKFKRRFS
jgi:peptidoglycan/LPS O-acetylase OafA/YrhL